MLTPYSEARLVGQGARRIQRAAVSAYIRESTGASSESGARDWIRDREAQEERRFYVGDESEQITFMGAVILYNPTPQMAAIWSRCCASSAPTRAPITPKMIKDLGPKLYPKNCTDSWRRWVVTPARAVINNAHDKAAARRSRSRATTRTSG
jgi:hypothetical protein